jgi:N-acetylglutamate synthase-like GNAT family acetyltransferase
MKSIVIREYQDSDLKEISNIVVRNMLEINSKDYGLSEMKLRAQEFNEKKLAEKFKYRKKVWVAIINDEVVGTVGLEADWDGTKDTYWVLTMFVKPEYHGEKIGARLMKHLEEYAKEIQAKKIIVPASITGNGFYYKLGYKYRDNKKELDDGGHYMMEKTL